MILDLFEFRDRVLALLVAAAAPPLRLFLNFFWGFNRGHTLTSPSPGKPSAFWIHGTTSSLRVPLTFPMCRIDKEYRVEEGQTGSKKNCFYDALGYTLVVLEVL